MKILYGVQATGNGHISRSREVIRNLKNLGHDVRVILSGRDPSLLWDMEVFEPFDAFRGLTFVTARGEVKYFATAKNLNLFRFYHDIISYDASAYDLVITDFEPISARIARKNKIPLFGIGHQYAFYYDIPVAGANPLARWIIKNFAFANYPIGLHWYHFDQPILPPIIPYHLDNTDETIADKILIYLPFEDLHAVQSLLKNIRTHHFYIYCSVNQPNDRENFYLRPFSRSGFLKDLIECNGVICNAGFELASEALYLGKRLLVKPIAGQMEQASNALALSQLKIGMSMKTLNPDSVEVWLNSLPNAPIDYPDVAKILAHWIENGQWDKDNIDGLARDVWNRMQFGFTG